MKQLRIDIALTLALKLCLLYLLWFLCFSPIKHKKSLDIADMQQQIFHSTTPKENQTDGR